jgi:hypothetical protein
MNLSFEFFRDINIGIKAKDPNWIALQADRQAATSEKVGNATVQLL